MTVQPRRIRRIAVVAAALPGLPLLYLLFWPVPVDPTAWQAPPNPGLADPFTSNNVLSRARVISLGPHHGPEDIAGGPDGLLYASTRDGHIVRFGPAGRNPEVFAVTGGRPLGIEFDRGGNLYVANAELGLQLVSPDGEVETLVREVGGQALVYTNDVGVAPDGSVYFTESSSKFPAAMPGGSYEASLLDILEHGGHGRLFRWRPGASPAEVLMDGLNFANGVAVSPDGSFLVVAETGHYRIWKYRLAGAGAGTAEIILEGLPAFPDNVNRGLGDRYWIGLVAPRNPLIDRLSGAPVLRRMILRLPRSLRPEAEPYAHVIAIDGNGDVLMNLRDTTLEFSALTGVYETRRMLYLATLFGNRVGALAKSDLVD